MMPPVATAATTAAEVHPAGVPSPTTVVGFEVSAPPSTPPSAGLPTGPAGGAAPVGAGSTGAVPIGVVGATGATEAGGVATDGGS